MSPSLSEDLLAGRYELAGTLGIGGMAEVYRAWDAVLCREVAVKVFHPGADLHDRRRFDNEVRTLARLSHPGLVSVHDAGADGRDAFVVLQLVDGHTLRDRIAQGPLPVEQVRRLGAHLAEALAYVHAQGVVHRDVKPSNILLDRDGTPYLADFGLAHLTGATRFTRSGQMVGTAPYLAPEQVRGAEVGPAADVYALGLVLLECLTGRREYLGGDVEAAVARLHRPPAVPSDLPSDLVHLLSLMTSLSARRRPTAQDCARALDTATVPLAPARSDDPYEDDQPSGVPEPRPRQVPKKTITASAAGLVAVVCIAWVSSGGTVPATSAPGESTPHAPTSTTTSSPATADRPVTDTVTVQAPAEQQPAAPQVDPAPEPEHKGRQQAPGKVEADNPKPAGKDKNAKP